MKSLTLIIILILTLSIIFVTLKRASAQVPITIWGYVYMPDGSPASGASVTVSAGGKSKSTSTGSSGKYKVDLTVSSIPVTVKVTAKKGSYSGSVTKSGVEGVVRIDVRLKAPSPAKPSPTKQYTKLTISTAKDEYVVNESVVINGSISPAMSVEITITLKRPNGSIHQAKVKTNTKGMFSYEFTADVCGLWQAYARFAGSDRYKSSESNTIKFYVKIKPSLNLNVRTEDYGQVIISGTVNPAMDRTPIIIYFSLDNGKTWLYLCNSTTNEDGYFEVSVNMNVSGTLLFKAVIPSTEIFVYSESAGEPVVRLISKEEAELREQLDNMKEYVSTLEYELKNLKEENEQLRSKLKNATSSLNEAEVSLANLKKTVLQLKSELELRDKEILQYQLIAILGTLISLIIGMLLGRRIKGK